MKPQDTPHGQSHASQSRDGLTVPARESAINVIRGQLDTLYQGDGGPSQQQNSAPRQQASTTATPDINQEQWKKYHSAWQEYYQKYYQHYYTGYVHKVLQERDSQQSGPTEPADAANTSDKKKEMSRLRQQIVTKARNSAKKARGSRHFIPLAAAICVVLVFAFLQYNRVLFGTVQAYVSPGAIDPNNVVIDPATDVAVGPDPKLVIPKINVNVPVIYNIGADEKSQLEAMKHGVAHWPGGDAAKSVPGQAGNTVVAGHSSNDLFEVSDYKFVFVQLEKLEAGDSIYMNYQGKRYTYSVVKKDIILPIGQWQNIIKATDKPMLVLVTCWPVGTAQKRLLVTAEQIAPDPTEVAPAPAPTETVETTEGMTGNSPSFFDWLFKLFS